MVSLNEYWSKNKDVFLIGVIAGVLTALILGTINPDLGGLLKGFGNKSFILLIIIGVLLSSIIKAILTKEAFNLPLIKRRVKENKIAILLITIASLLFIAPNTELFASSSIKIPYVKAVTATGIPALFALIPTLIAGFPLWFVMLIIAGLVVLIGLPIIGFLTFMSNNGTVIILIGGIILGLFLINKLRK